MSAGDGGAQAARAITPAPKTAEDRRAEELKLSFARAAALASEAIIEVEDIGTVCGMQPEEVNAALRDQVVARLVESEALRMIGDGRMARARAHVLLNKALSQVSEMVENGAMPASSLLKVAEVAYRVSGLAEDAVARTKQQSEKSLPVVEFRFLPGPRFEFVHIKDVGDAG